MDTNKFEQLIKKLDGDSLDAICEVIGEGEAFQNYNKGKSTMRDWFLHRLNEAAISAQSTGSSGVAAEPVAWLWELIDSQGWPRRHVALGRPTLTDYVRNVEPLFKHPPAPPAGGGETRKAVHRDPDRFGQLLADSRPAMPDGYKAELVNPFVKPSPASPAGDLISLSAETAYESWRLAHNSDVDAPLPSTKSVFVAGYSAAAPAAPRKGPSAEEIERIFLRFLYGGGHITEAMRRNVADPVRQLLALLTPADQGETL